MKIAHVICTFPPYRGGMGNSAWHFADALTKYKHQLTVFTPLYNRQRINGFVNSNPAVKIVRLRPVFSIGNSAVVPQLLWKLHGFDLIHLHYPFYGGAEIVWFLKLLLGKKLKLVIHYHMDNQAKGVKGKIFALHQKFFLPLILKQAEEITCASLDYIKHSKVGKYYRANPQKFSQVPFGVDLNEFKPRDSRMEQKTGSDYDNHDNLEEGKIKKFLFVGSLDTAHYFKGVDNLLQAWSLLKLTANQAKLVIVGQGDLEDHYRQIAQNLEITQQVEFITNADDCQLVNCYNQAEALILPSINQSEAFGLVLLEAMACGKPVIASNLPGVRGVFRNNEQGLLIKPNDIEDLAEKIKRLLNNETLSHKLGQAARQLVEEQYTWGKAAEKLNEIYSRVKNAPKNILIKNNNHGDKDRTKK